MATKYDSKQLQYLEKKELTCADFTDLASDLLDSELPLTLAGRLEAHVDECADCQQDLVELQMLLEVAKTAFTEPMPKDVRSRLHQRLNKELGLSLP